MLCRRQKRREINVYHSGSDFAVGQTCTYTQLIDDKLVHGFADLTGDHNQIHVDDAFAKKTKFGQRIAHGGILFGIISKVLGMDMPGVGTVYLSQLVNFRPVFIGDTVTLVATITRSAQVRRQDRRRHHEADW